MTLPSEEYMLTHPDEWPQWPYLPMKKRDLAKQRVNLGLVREGGATGLQFSENQNLFFSSHEREWRDVTIQQLAEEGWVVD